MISNDGIRRRFKRFLFFVLSIITLIVLGKVLLRSGERNYGYFVLFLGTASAVSFPFFFVERPFGMNAVVEMITTSAMSVFVLISGLRLLGRHQPRTTSS